MIRQYTFNAAVCRNIILLLLFPDNSNYLLQGSLQIFPVGKSFLLEQYPGSHKERRGLCPRKRKGFQIIGASGCKGINIK
ncbi:hypothetical protein Tfer_0811 [Thermincola ferriacetica]|uniref:Uncharacterized protein n=1 Tax=Thermincola ferriacetica TaxID=281456 RepID=A0A0L6W4W8_9FIRM|nr:hypothetical protein Tfer_0811 [Thermincola ferriacetica]